MSYPQELDTLTSDQLRAELDRRHFLLSQGLCPYCSQSIHTHTCRYAPLALDQPQRIEEYHRLLPEESPYFFYALRSQEDSYAFIQRTIFHIHLCGFWVQADFKIANAQGLCPSCLAKMPHAQIKIHPNPSDPAFTETVNGWGCTSCRLFVPYPQPPIIAPCSSCKQPMAKEPTGYRCVWCSPLARSNKAHQKTRDPSSLPEALAKNQDTQLCIKCGGVSIRRGSCYVCQECGETSSCG